MADSDALRARRYRQHRQGDHSACRHGRVLAPARPRLSEVGGAPTPSTLPEGDFDPVAEMRALARRLADAYGEDTGNAGLARELRMTLLALEAVPAEPEWDPIAELQKAEWDARRREREPPTF